MTGDCPTCGTPREYQRDIWPSAPKLYVLVVGDYDDARPVGVFHTIEEAQAAYTPEGAAWRVPLGQSEGTPVVSTIGNGGRDWDGADIYALEMGAAPVIVRG